MFQGFAYDHNKRNADINDSMFYWAEENAPHGSSLVLFFPLTFPASSHRKQTLVVSGLSR